MMDNVKPGSGVKKVSVRGVRRIKISGEFIRLDALLKFASIASTGGEAKVLIQSGEVFVGKEPCTQRGKKLRDGDTVRYGGETLVIRSGTPGKL